MKAHLVLPVAILTAVAAVRHVVAQATSFVISDRAALDMDFMRDLNDLDVTSLAKQNSTWVVADVAIDPGSNMPMGRMVPETGPNSRLVVTVFFKGTAKIITVVHGSFDKKEWNFGWDNPTIFRGGSGRRPVEVGKDRLHDGIFLLQINPTSDKEDQFISVHMLPDANWGPLLLEAAQYAASHADMFAPGKIEQNRATLTSLAQDKNPLLALAAVRLLVPAGMPEPDVVRNSLTNRPYIVQAQMIDTIIANTTEKNAEASYSAMEPVLTSSTSAEVAEGFAAGVTFGHTPKGEGKKLADRLIQTISGKLAKLSNPPAAKKAAERILEIQRLSGG